MPIKDPKKWNKKKHGTKTTTKTKKKEEKPKKKKVAKKKVEKKEEPKKKRQSKKRTVEQMTKDQAAEKRKRRKEVRQRLKEKAEETPFVSKIDVVDAPPEKKNVKPLNTYGGEKEPSTKRVEKYLENLTGKLSAIATVLKKKKCRARRGFSPIQIYLMRRFECTVAFVGRKKGYLVVTGGESVYFDIPEVVQEFMDAYNEGRFKNLHPKQKEKDK